jgi:hypothetical protein
MAQDTTTATGGRNLKVLVFLVATALFFAVTLLISFFGVIVMINRLGIPADQGPNFFMLGLVPPSILTVLLYFKGFGRFL